MAPVNARSTSTSLRKSVGKIPREVDVRLVREAAKKRAMATQNSRGRQKKTTPLAIKQTWHNTKDLNAVFEILKMPPELVVRSFREIPYGLKMELERWEREQVTLSTGFWESTGNPKVVARVLGIPEADLLERHFLLPKEMVDELKKK